MPGDVRELHKSLLEHYQPSSIEPVVLRDVGLDVQMHHDFIRELEIPLWARNRALHYLAGNYKTIGRTSPLETNLQCLGQLDPAKLPGPVAQAELGARPSRIGLTWRRRGSPGRSDVPCARPVQL
jgi:hypothetical protein